MRRFLLTALTLVVAAAALAVWLQRDALALQWACYKVTSAADYSAFRQSIASFEQPPYDYQRMRTLLSRWHTGNERFDEFLARYLFDTPCSEELREVFSRELSWRDGLLDAWAAHWSEQKGDTAEQIASIRRYLEALEAADPPHSLTWRDLLDIQGAFAYSGHARLAHRLTPDNWRPRYERWSAEGK